MRKLKILAKPAFSNSEKNPYNYLLYSNLAKDGTCIVEEFTPIKALVNKYDILHFHWPDVMISESRVIKSFLTAVSFFFLVQWMKLRGTRFVWTVHNFMSHDFTQESYSAQKLEQWYWKTLVHMLDGIIALSKTSLKEVVAHYPVLSTKRQFIIPHGHYKDIYPDNISREQARKELGVDHEDVLITYFGQIRPYKNVPQLIEQFLKVRKNHRKLLVAGNPADQKLHNEIESLVDGQSDYIKTILKFIPHDEVQTIFRASDLVVIPYKNILNSGSVLLSLSFDVPVLVPEKGSIVELKEIFGRRWIRTYQREFSSDILDYQIQQVLKTDLERCEKIKQFNWTTIAKQTLRAYQELTN